MVYIYARNKYDDMKKSIEDDSSENLAVSKTCRPALLTRGSIQLKRLPYTVKNIFFGKDVGTSSINVSIFDLRGFHIGHHNKGMILALRDVVDSSTLSNTWPKHFPLPTIYHFSKSST